MLDEIAATLGDAVPKLLFFAPNSDALDQALALNPACRACAARRKFWRSSRLLMSAVLPERTRPRATGRSTRQPTTPTLPAPRS